MTRARAARSTEGYETLRDLWTGFWRSQVLFAAVEQGLFELLATGPRSAVEVARELGLDERLTVDVLEVLVGERLLSRKTGTTGSEYMTTEVADRHLRAGAEEDLTAMIKLAKSRQYAQWARLGESLVSGEPVGPNGQSRRTVISEMASDGAGALDGFSRSIGNVFRGTFERFLSVVDLSDVTEVLDVGGSTGLFSILAATRYPHLSCVSFDHPSMVPIARARIGEHPCADRIRVVGGDFFEELPSTPFAHMSNVLHDWVGANRTDLLSSLFRAVEPGGRLAIVGPLLGGDPFGGAHLLSLNIHLEMGGRVPSLDELVADCEAVGFRGWRRHRLDAVSHAVVFGKPLED